MLTFDETSQSRDPLRRIDVMLGRMRPLYATAVLTLAAVAAALATLLAIAALGGPPVTRTVTGVTILVTAIVATPLTLYSQQLIRKLRASRQALKDVTARLAVALDHAEQASRAKSAFVANMSHELRTPLNAIIGFAEMIHGQHIGPVGNSRYLSYAGDIHASGQHLLSIINDILDLSKIEAGKMSIDDAAEFDLSHSVESSGRIVGAIAERAGVLLSIDPALPAVRLIGVERMIQQILINLLNNAVKFTPQGGSVALAGALQTDGSFELTVRDNGIGMSKDEVARALMPFGQIKNAMNRNQKGTGLGLPLSKSMLELHDGRLLIKSAPQQGTLVSLIFPPHRVVVARDEEAQLQARG
jgi:signal transduction histidine kinase